LSIVVTHELYSFAYVVIACCIACVVFDFFSELLSTFRMGTVASCVLDVIFWIFIIAFMWMSLISSNDGRLRLYQILGGILGCFLYFFSLRFIVSLIFKNIFKFIRFILKILLTPVRFLYKILVRVFLKIWKVRKIQWIPKINRLGRKQKQK